MGTASAKEIVCVCVRVREGETENHFREQKTISVNAVVVYDLVSIISLPRLSHAALLLWERDKCIKLSWYEVFCQESHLS